MNSLQVCKHTAIAKFQATAVHMAAQKKNKQRQQYVSKTANLNAPDA